MSAFSEDLVIALEPRRISCCQRIPRYAAMASSLQGEAMKASYHNAVYAFAKDILEGALGAKVSLANRWILWAWDLMECREDQGTRDTLVSYSGIYVVLSSSVGLPILCSPQGNSGLVTPDKSWFYGHHMVNGIWPEESRPVSVDAIPTSLYDRTKRLEVLFHQTLVTITDFTAEFRTMANIAAGCSPLSRLIVIRSSPMPPKMRSHNARWFNDAYTTGIATVLERTPMTDFRFGPTIDEARPWTLFALSDLSWNSFHHQPLDGFQSVFLVYPTNISDVLFDVCRNKGLDLRRDLCCVPALRPDPNKENLFEFTTYGALCKPIGFNLFNSPQCRVCGDGMTSGAPPKLAIPITRKSILSALDAADD